MSAEEVEAYGELFERLGEDLGKMLRDRRVVEEFIARYMARGDGLPPVSPWSVTGG
jgi:hypothetical protein